jgi:hypothetical protein
MEGESLWVDVMGKTVEEAQRKDETMGKGEIVIFRLRQLSHHLHP